jgi:hypothetical protein
MKRGSNFHKRFGNPPRITLTFERTTDQALLRDDAQRTLEAYTEILRSLLKREPTQDEIFGNVLIPEAAEAVFVKNG